MEVRDASTVVLLRDGPAGLQAWLLTRVTQMVFAAGMSVFPGGRVEPDDAELPFAPGAGERVAAGFGCDEPTARALLGAAVRETFEETGVLLTSPAAELTDARAGVEDGTVDFGQLLREHGLTVDAQALHPWAHWVTPEGEPRRYDTHFFVAALPTGAQADDLTSEASVASWVGVDEALEQAERGERGLLPPTLMTLSSLEPYATAADVIAAAADRQIETIRPSLLRGEDGSLLVELPDGTVVALPAPRTGPGR
jgi:8-oxo-dGTP pyrophosphatase MutT (NUDIX family)